VTKRREPSEEAVILLGDTHVGKWTPHYNLKVAASSFWYVKDSALRILGRYPSISKIHILLLGDIVEGEEVYPEQSHFLDFIDPDRLKEYGVSETSTLPTTPAYLQVVLSAQLVAAFIRSFTSHGYMVEVAGVIGNHGRSQRRFHPLTNYDAFVYALLQKEMRGEKGVELHPLSISWRFQFHQHEVLGRKIVMLHNAEFRCYQGIPFYSIINKVHRWCGQGVLPSDVSIVAVGHFHVPFIFYGFPTIIVNGTTVTSDDPYPIVRLGFRSSNIQLMLIISEEKELPTVYALPSLPNWAAPLFEGDVHGLGEGAGGLQERKQRKV